MIYLNKSSRLSDKVYYLSWFVWVMVRRLFRMQVLRQSLKAHQSSVPPDSSLRTGFQVYLSMCWDPYVSPGCTIPLVPGMSCPFYCYYNWWWYGLGGGWLSYIRLWVGGQVVGIILMFLFSFVFFCFCILFSCFQ